MAIRLGGDNDMFAHIWPMDQCAVLYEFAKRYPGEDVELDLGRNCVLVVQSPGAFEHVLRRRPENYRKSLGHFTELIGQSRLSTDGDLWTYLRNLSNTDISRVNPAAIVAAVREPFERARDRLEAESCDRRIVNIDTAIERAAAESVCKGLLGFPPEIHGDETLADIVHLARLARVRNYGAQGQTPAEMKALERDGQAADKRLSTRLSGIWDRHVDRSDPKRDLLSRIVLDDSGKVDPRGEVLTLFAAGFETTASSVGWGLFLLANQPDLQEELRRECQTRLGDDLKVAELEQCRKLQAFTRESLRIFPTLPMIGRVAVEADEIEGTSVPSGRLVLGSIVGLHMNRQVFSEPASVRLDRFPDGSIPREFQGHYLPFSDGRRVCPGVRFANYEAMAALSIILRRLKVLPGPKEPLRFDWVFTLRRHGGQKLRFEVLT